MDPVLLDLHDGVARVTFNRPQRRNALNLAMRERMAEVVQELRRTDDIRAVVLTGAGGAFCSGGDLEGILGAELDNDGWRTRMRGLHHWLKDLMTLEKPVIAAVDGAAYGAGFSLALVADVILATPRARFSMSFLKVGAVPDLAALYSLPRAVGPRLARELMLSTQELDAERAHALGIVSEVVASEQLLARAQQIAHSFTGASALAVGLVKTLTARSINSDLDSMLDAEAAAQALVFGCDYHRQAIDRFLTKQPPLFVWPQASEQDA